MDMQSKILKCLCCKTEVSNNSTTCPQCGDPDPFAILECLRHTGFFRREYWWSVFWGLVGSFGVFAAFFFVYEYGWWILLIPIGMVALSVKGTSSAENDYLRESQHFYNQLTRLKSEDDPWYQNFRERHRSI